MQPFKTDGNFKHCNFKPYKIQVPWTEIPPFHISSPQTSETLVHKNPCIISKIIIKHIL